MSIVTRSNPRTLRIGAVDFGAVDCAVMAIVNRTPDSFYDRGATYGLSEALDRADRVVGEGARIVDVGGVKAGPGDEVDAAEELRRVVDLVAGIHDRHPGVVVSVDTWRAEVADRACEAGATLVNDAWGGVDPRLAEVAAKHGAGLVCTHAGGLPPRTRPHRIGYDDVVADVVALTTGLAGRAVAAGVPAESVLVDPGHDFGKNTKHSLEVTRRLDALVATGWPVLVALSHKDFVAESLDVPLGERLEGTLAATAVSVWHGVRVVRAHDVVPTLRVIRMVEAIAGRREPAVLRRGLA